LAVQTAIANENPAKQVQVSLKESDEADKIDVRLLLKESDTLSLSLSLSNTGSDSTGNNRLSVVASHANVWGLDHQASLAYTTSPERIKEVLSTRVRVEQVIHKDTSQRTFITGDAARNEMAAHVYDITYGSLHPRVDTLVCIDDSIVRGTTLRQSILRMLSRLKPKCIVIVSSAPQIRYPDCYGIDMSQIGRFIAFQAAIELLKAGGLHEVIEQTKARILALKAEGNMEAENCVKAIYAPFTEVQISARIAEMLHSPDLDCDVKIVFQPVENLAKALPEHRGDWYFTGNYPTPGGNRVVNQAFLNYLDGRDERSY
jgi:amidophosphoribosyltransferase